MPKPNDRGTVPYIALALFFTFAATYQARFLVDLRRDFTFQYAAPPFMLGSPWPTVTEVFEARTRPTGLQPGDRILSIDGRSPDGLSDLFRPVRLKKPGDTIDVIAERGGTERQHVVPLTSVRSRRIGPLVYVHAARGCRHQPAAVIRDVPIADPRRHSTNPSRSPTAAPPPRNEAGPP